RITFNISCGPRSQHNFARLEASLKLNHGLSLPGDAQLSFAKTIAGAQAVDLSVLIQTQSRLDDHSPAPPASTLPLPLPQPPPARGREPCPAAAARRVQKNDGPTQAAHDGSPLLDLAGRSLGRVEGAPRDRDPRHRPAVAAAPLPRI